jgi:glycosyltransferase involved in cell wall biosynthesis
MRVLFVIPYFYEAWAYGGQPRSAFEMAKSLVGRGHDVEVLTTDSSGASRLSVPHDGFTRVVDGITIRYYRNLSNTMAFRHRVFLPIAFFRDVPQRVRSADVVHIHELRSLLSVYAASASTRHSIPFVLSPHGGLRHLGRRSLKTVFDYVWGRRILQGASAVIAISPTEEQDAAAMKVPADRIFHVPNSVPAVSPDSFPQEGTFRLEHGLPPGRMVLFLGRLHPVKGADLLVEAFARLCRDSGDADAHLVLAGPDDGQGPQLRRMVTRLKISDRVTFTGYLDQTKKIRAIVDSRVVVVPSRSEVFAITALEALMCSRPVLLSSSCDLSTVLREENGVRTFAHDSIEDLHAKLRQTLGDQGLFQNAARGRAFVVRQFSPEALAIGLENAYLSAGARHG